MFDVLEEEGYVIYHKKEANIQFGGGNCVEYGLVKLDKEIFSLRKEVLKRKSEDVLRVEAAKTATVSSVWVSRLSVAMLIDQPVYHLALLYCRYSATPFHSWNNRDIQYVEEA